MIVDYLSLNEISRYPFEDNSTLQAVDLTYLSNDHFLDLLVVAKTSSPVGAYVSTYSSNGSSITLGFTLFNSAGTTVTTGAFTIANASIVERQFYGAASTDMAFKVVFGPGFIRDKGTTFNKTFTKPATTLASSAFVNMVPRVSSIALYNWDKNTNEQAGGALVTISGSELVETDLTLEEGANMQFLSLSGVPNIGVLPGEGTGLYDGCSSELFIRTINSIGPDSNRNFHFLADDCYTVTPGDALALFTNICTPKCSTEQLGAFAHYLNRIRDGISTISALAAVTYTNIKEEIERYNSEVAPVKNLPFYRVKFEQFDTVDDGRYYYSIAAGFFNPTGEIATLDVTFASEATLLDFRYRIGADTTPLTSPSMTVDVPCLGSCIVNIVFSGPNNVPLEITGSFGGQSVGYSAILT